MRAPLASTRVQFYLARADAAGPQSDGLGHYAMPGGTYNIWSTGTDTTQRSIGAGGNGRPTSPSRRWFQRGLLHVAARMGRTTHTPEIG
ncbi:hypothetical protein ABIE21_001645 [Conyzicola nivalis]|uniref:Uncharacterized protein n=1 Tax=Conyzicola nivalis TaxID=1477021 RepID=A0ABV2QM67_9MICO